MTRMAGQVFESATKDYFADAAKRHGFKAGSEGGNAANLRQQYEDATKGLDQDLAFQALEGGRYFSDSDKARYDKLVADRDAAATTTNTNTTNTTTSTTTPEQGAQDLMNNYVQNVSQDQSFDRDFGDNQNTIGNENTIYGNVNQGNQDFSVNIGSQSASQGSGSGASGESSLNNMQIAASYNALNENQYERSQAKFNPYAKAQGNIDATKKSTGVKEGNRATNELYGGLRDLYRSQTTNYMTNLFGDYFNQTDYKPPKWNPPAAPSAINPDYDDD